MHIDIPFHLISLCLLDRDMAVEQADIAAAPAMRSANVVKTVEELENEMNQSSYTINQV